MTKFMILRYLDEIASKLADLRAEVEKLSEDTTVAESTQFVDKLKLQPLVAKAFAEMGIIGEPIDAETLQEMIAACGVRPEENAFSRGIIQMREE